MISFKFKPAICTYVSSPGCTHCSFWSKQLLLLKSLEQERRKCWKSEC